MPTSSSDKCLPPLTVDEVQGICTAYGMGARDEHLHSPMAEYTDPALVQAYRYGREMYAKVQTMKPAQGPRGRK